MTPPRTYHCFYCKKCVMRLDHHCSWIGVCIGLLNQKFYWQFLMYQCLSLLIVTVTVFVLEGFTVLSCASAVFFLEIAVLFTMQTVLILQNKTLTDKIYLLKENNIYSHKTCLENWE